MHYVDDTGLDYQASCQQYGHNDALQLDAFYRAAYLPLLNPTHPEVIAAHEDYRLGRYCQRRYSLVLPVEMDWLENSPAFTALDMAIRQSSFAEKIAWEVMTARRARVHATFCRGIQEDALPARVTHFERVIARSAKPRFRVGGLFTGNKNTGRLYFKLYPEQTPDGNVFHHLQHALGETPSPMWLTGYYHFQDALDVAQTRQLMAIMARFGDATLAEVTASELWLLGTHDDMALSGEVLHQFRFAE